MSAITHATLQRKCSCGGDAVHGECEACKKKKAASLQRKAASAATPGYAPPIVHEVLRSPGQPLDQQTRAFMEPRFGHDFSKVRIHADDLASQSAQSVNALAYTVGNNIAFRSGLYAPSSSEGRRLLAHELTHVVQQDHLLSVRASEVAVGASDSPFEGKADLMAMRLSRGECPIVQVGDTESVLQRSVACGDKCPPREPGERSRTQAAPLVVSALEAPEYGWRIGPFGIGFAKTQSLRSDPNWIILDKAIAESALPNNSDSPTTGWQIDGYSDCSGDANQNLYLRLERAQQVFAMLSAEAQSRVSDHVSAAPLTDCVADNSTEENRGYNRSVVIRSIGHSHSDPPPIPPPWKPDPNCPDFFCEAYASRESALNHRDNESYWLLNGISLAYGNRAVPIWELYLSGGVRTVLDETKEFGQDFADSEVTTNATQYLITEVKRRLIAEPPNIEPSGEATLDIATVIPEAIEELTTPGQPNSMDFTGDRGIPGLLAGGISPKGQQANNKFGHIPSSYDDERRAAGTVRLIRGDADHDPNEVLAIVSISYVVSDTVDLCPGNCGTGNQLIATLPLSRLEASRISGDVPFLVAFPAPKVKSESEFLIEPATPFLPKPLWDYD